MSVATDMLPASQARGTRLLELLQSEPRFPRSRKTLTVPSNVARHDLLCRRACYIERNAYISSLQSRRWCNEASHGREKRRNPPSRIRSKRVERRFIVAADSKKCFEQFMAMNGVHVCAHVCDTSDGDSVWVVATARATPCAAVSKGM
jgi:hypothetical protein